MKKINRITALFSAVMMLLTVLAPAALAKTNEEDFNVVIFGASNTNGYAHHGYLQDQYYNWDGSADQIADWDAVTAGDKKMDEVDAWNPRGFLESGQKVSGYLKMVDGTFPVLLREALEKKGKNVNIFQGAFSTMRAEELNILLYDIEDENAYDDFTKSRFTDPDGDYKFFVTEGGVNKLSGEFRDATDNADLIVYDLGANNFLNFLTYRIVAGENWSVDMSYVLGDEIGAIYNSCKEQIREKIKEIMGGETPEATKFLAEYLDTVTYCYCGFIVNFDKTMAYIRENNPDADVVVVSIQNPIAGLDISYDGFTVPYGQIVSSLTDMANAYTGVISPYHNTYAYADVSSTDGCLPGHIDELKTYRTGHPETLSQEMKDFVDTQESDHLLIKEKVTQYLETKGITKSGKTQEEYEALRKPYLDAAYDTIFTIMQNCIGDGGGSGNSADGLITGEIDFYDQMSKALTEPVNAALDLVAGGMTYQDEDFKEKLQEWVAYYVKDDYKLYFEFQIRVCLGHSYFAHPNKTGHTTLTKAVMKAWNREITGKQAFKRAFSQTKNKMTCLYQDYGPQAMTRLIEKIGKLFNDNDLTELSAQAANDRISTGDLGDALSDKLMLSDAKDCETINRAIDETSKEIKAEKAAANHMGSNSFKMTLAAFGQKVKNAFTGLKNLFSGK